MNTSIFKSYEDFISKKKQGENGVSGKFALLHPDYQEDNHGNTNCWNCVGCISCINCKNCDGCRGLIDRCDAVDEGTKGWRKKGEPENAPAIENIHQKILKAVTEDGDLYMGAFHTCETTHCRAGWAVHLAGEKGKLLEEVYGPGQTALAIFKKSSPIRVSPNRFFESNEVAMEDIKRCAQEEIKLNKLSVEPLKDNNMKEKMKEDLFQLASNLVGKAEVLDNFSQMPGLAEPLKMGFIGSRQAFASAANDIVGVLEKHYTEDELKAYSGPKEEENPKENGNDSDQSKAPAPEELTDKLKEIAALMALANLMGKM